MSARKIAWKLGIPLLLASAAFGFCLLVLELSLRMVGFDRLGSIEKGRRLVLRESEHPERRFELIPNATGFAWHTNVRVNSYGMRDREYPVARSGAPRIVALGDSITFGSGVASADRFTEQLEARLAARLAGPVEVLNLGVGGYDSLQEVATLEHVGLRFDPDLVVLAYCVNDIVDNSPNLDYIRSLENTDSSLYRLRSAQLVRVFLDRLRLIRQLEFDNEDARFAARYGDRIAPLRDDHELTALREALRVQLEREPDPDFHLAWYLSDVHLGRLEFALARLAALRREHGFELIVAILPYLGESPSFDVVYRLVAHMTRSHGLETLLLQSSLERRAGDLATLRLWDADPIHPNARGHRLIAEALEPAVAAKLTGSVPQEAPRAAVRR